jgi:hypothetical protein
LAVRLREEGKDRLQGGALPDEGMMRNIT